MKSTLRVAIISDLHASSSGDSTAESFLNIDIPETQVSQHPFGALEGLIDGDKKIRADILLCPGDITNRARPEPLVYAWKKIQEIGNKLGVSLVAATAGNHDLDSRFEHNKFDARGMVQGLDPKFPLDQDSDFDRYWSRHFVIRDHGQCRIVILNSAAYHGFKDEHKHGRICTYTLDRLKEELEDLGSRCPVEFNILLCHHHPERQARLDEPDYQAMEFGTNLLDLLGNGGHGRWIVVHGHMHNPQIAYAAGGATSPIVFSAGSFSAFPYPLQKGRAFNQFYILEFHIGDGLRNGLFGRGNAWDYIPGDGWQPAGYRAEIPAEFGFGCRTDPAALADRLADGRDGKSLSCSWGEALEVVPDLRFLLPRDMVQFEDCLESKYAHGVSRIRGKPSSVSPFTSED